MSAGDGHFWENEMKAKVIFILFIGVMLFGCSKSEDMDTFVSIDRKMNSGQYEYVIQETEKYIQDYPDSFKGWNLLGWAYLKMDQLQKAEECFTRSININDKWDNAYVGKGVLYRKMGKLDKARQSYLKATSLVPDNAEAFSSLLVVELLDGNNKEAVEYGEKAWALRKNLPSIPANLSIAYHYLGDFTKRDEFYKHAKELGYHNLQAIDDIIDGRTTIK
jgi:tetratricopeptide (TPR) repeat protein